MKPVSKVNRQSEVERADAVAVPYAAAWLGAAGLLPFAAGAIALWVLPATQAARAARALVGYAAIILAFMGAVHWGWSWRPVHVPTPGSGSRSVWCRRWSARPR